MALDLRAIAALCALALAYRCIVPARWRAWALLLISLCAVYLLQPRLPIRYADFILPTLSLLIAGCCWVITLRQGLSIQRADQLTMLISGGVILLMTLNRFLAPEIRFTPSRPPDPLPIIILVIGVGAFILVLAQMNRRRPLWVWLALISLIGLLIALKTEPLAAMIAAQWRSQTAQDVSLASAFDLNWLGFSYLAFRLIHTLRDRQAGLLPDISLRDYLCYLVFPASLVAGPIDRVERFKSDLDALPEQPRFPPDQFAQAGERIIVGLVKKFVIADSLAQGAALSPALAAQTDGTLWWWVLLYGYAMRLFFDFSGYSDLAIGIGMLFGIKLPENFDRPYLKTNLTRFWQSWHMTLSTWARSYIFSPLSRGLLRRQPRPPVVIIVLVAHLTTMLIIGVWHGVTVNFIIWGAWHGIGLFVHKQWSDRTRGWYLSLQNHPVRFRLWSGLGWALTFHYVLLGWVWFALPDPTSALRAFAALFGGDV